MRLVLIADTHVPRRARDLPLPVWRAAERADLVIHAGDWTDVALLDAMQSRVPRLVGVVGNNDGPELVGRLPEVATVDAAGVRVVVVHETGGSKGREVRCDRHHPDADVVVFGHSHIPWDTTTPRGMRLLNPGSPTDRRRQPRATFMTAEATDGVLRRVRLHPL